MEKTEAPTKVDPNLGPQGRLCPVPADLGLELHVDSNTGPRADVTADADAHASHFQPGGHDGVQV